MKLLPVLFVVAGGLPAGAQIGDVDCPGPGCPGGIIMAPAAEPPEAEDPNPQAPLLFFEAGPVHVGDEAVGGWAPLVGRCHDVTFTLPQQVRSVLLSADVYGAERTYLIIQGRQIPYAAQVPEAGQARPNYWQTVPSRQVDVPDPAAERVTLGICGMPLPDSPDGPDDLDDFQLRNVRIEAL